MTHPNQRNQQCGILTGSNRGPSQRLSPNVGMHSVIRRSAHAGVRGVADYREVRHEKQKDKLDPATMVPAVPHQADDENCGAFKMERGFGLTVLRPIPRLPPVTIATLRGDCLLCSDIFFSFDSSIYAATVANRVRVSATTRAANFGSHTSGEPCIGWPPSS